MSYTSMFQGNIVDGRLAAVPSLDTNVQTLEERIQALETRSETIISEALAAAYPIGSIYISVSPTSPGDLFGGEWERIATGRCLIGAGSAEDIVDNTTSYYGDLNKPNTSHPVNELGGQFYHKLLTAEMPEHQHYIRVCSVDDIYNSGADFAYVRWGSNWTGTKPTQLMGSGEQHNNMPPYLAVYMWKRIS